MNDELICRFTSGLESLSFLETGIGMIDGDLTLTFECTTASPSVSPTSSRPTATPSRSPSTRPTTQQPTSPPTTQQPSPPPTRRCVDDDEAVIDYAKQHISSRLTISGCGQLSALCTYYDEVSWYCPVTCGICGATGRRLLAGQ